MFIIQKQESTNKTLRLPDELIERLEEIAAFENISFNQLVVQCCEYAINNLPRKNKTIKITSTEDFRQKKKLYRTAFLKYMAENSNSSPQSASQTFTDGIYSSQPRHEAMNVDFYKLLKGEISIEDYQKALELYFAKTGRTAAFNLRGYIDSFKKVQEFFKQAEYI
ncbi:MAG: YlcI/YnfO family protein [Anaerovoracaceae bacterium]|jgi:hypothetical protein